MLQRWKIACAMPENHETCRFVKHIVQWKKKDAAWEKPILEDA